MLIENCGVRRPRHPCLASRGPCQVVCCIVFEIECVIEFVIEFEFEIEFELRVFAPHVRHQRAIVAFVAVGRDTRGLPFGCVFCGPSRGPIASPLDGTGHLRGSSTLTSVCLAVGSVGKAAPDVFGASGSSVEVGDGGRLGGGATFGPTFWQPSLYVCGR